MFSGKPVKSYFLSYSTNSGVDGRMRCLMRSVQYKASPWCSGVLSGFNDYRSILAVIYGFEIPTARDDPPSSAEFRLLLLIL